MSQAAQLVGDWKLMSAEDFAHGKWEPSFGEKPEGYFSFSANGHVSVQFMQTPVSELHTHQPHEVYLAYFGTYSVDESKGVINIEVRAALQAKLIGTLQVRPFRLEGDQLSIGDGKSYRRAFRRIT